MSYAVVQTNHANGGAVSGATVTTIAYPGAVTANNLLVACMSYDAGDTAALTGGGTWTKGGGQTDSGDGQKGEWWYAVATGGATTVTLASGGLHACAVVIAEISGVATTSPLDVADATKAFATLSTTTDANTSNNITPAAGSELLLSFIYDQTGNAPTFTAGTGWTLVAAEPGASGFDGATAMEWQTGTTGAQHSKWTTNKADTGTVQIAAFKAAGGGSTKSITPAAINATSAMSGGLQALRAIKPASINATSTVTGNVTALKQIKAASINATSAVTATVTALRAIRPAAINATSAVTASLTKPGTKAIVPAAINATSTITGAVVRLAAVRPSSINATSAVTGAVHRVAGILPASISATSTVTGSIKRAAGILPASINATSAVTGSLQRLATMRASINATSFMSAVVTGGLAALAYIEPTIARGLIPGLSWRTRSTRN